MNAIEVRGLHKEYRSIRGRRTVAVDGLDLAVEAGGVFGFLGPNGSGKTTTIRCLLGLAPTSAGSCEVLGAPSDSRLASVIGRIGALVEAPALFPTFSGRRNLELLADLGRIPRTRVDEVLETVGLRDRQKDLVKKYSLGMRQRLGIAAALLKDPELLILDEPANGLDPAGIKQVRSLLRRLGDEGRTVFVSSHLLTEVQQICDHVAILARGRCVASGPVSEVLRSGRADGMVVKLADLEAGRIALQAEGMTAAIRDGALYVDVPPDSGALVSRALAERGLYPTELRPDEVDLETVFLELTDQGEAAA
ncbi:MAG: type transport system ATP-binding protein [Actinomycetota bacterium]|jgi:ABC-2 type transport system ATP-binding protein|nr:type transport system ATP-binding protein [Actinomycetota bacterium]